MDGRNILETLEKYREIKNKIVPYMLFFYFICLCGQVWEIIFFSIRYRSKYTFLEVLLGYSGTLHGPWIPIYGVCATLMLLLKEKLNVGKVRYFFTCMGVCAGIEYATSWVLEKVFNTRWWDYSDLFLNLNGRICAMSVLGFPAAGMIVSYKFAPYFWKKLNAVPQKYLDIVCIVLTVLFVTDVIVSLISPVKGVGVFSV